MQEIKTNLHDINKMMISQLTPISDDRLVLLRDGINKLNDGNSKYFMLLSNDKRDYTIFHINDNSEKELDTEVLETIRNRGPISEYDIILNNGKISAIEIWIKDAFYALFPYDLGVVEV